MQNLLSKVHQLENIQDLQVFLTVADEVKKDLQAYASTGAIRLDQFQDLENFRSGVVKNRLSKIEQKLSEKKPYVEQFNIQEKFVEKIANACKNTKDMTPVYNMGVANGSNQYGDGFFGESTSGDWAYFDEYQQSELNAGIEQSECFAFPRHLDNYRLISTPQGVVPVLRCVPINNGIAGIDWVTFSFEQEKFGEKYANLKADEVELGLGDAIETWLDQWLHEIFGFGLGQKREKGMHFYKYGYDLQDNLGLVLFGHSSKRISIQINGTGCALARHGWNEQLFDFLNECKKPKLNRVDLAFDDFDGEFLSVDLADDWDTQGGFWCGGKQPETQQLGDWKRPSGKGRTFTVGNRTSGKYARFYERGKKEGDEHSLWCRAEIEFKSTDRYIPLDILLNPSSYFKGAYPCLEVLANQLNDYNAPSKPEIVKKQSKINWDKAIQITKHQFGKYIRQFRKVYDDVELLNILSSEKDDVPKRLQFSHHAIMQTVRLKENTYHDDNDVLPLFVGVMGVNQPMYQEFIHAI